MVLTSEHSQGKWQFTGKAKGGDQQVENQQEATSRLGKNSVSRVPKAFLLKTGQGDQKSPKGMVASENPSERY